MNVVVSVIIPVYNAERFLCRCIDSIRAQDFRDLEIILVDDGSSDGSPKIAQDYTFQDERIVFLKQENLGVSVARNRGLDVARGEFVAFVDADDHVTQDYVSTLVQAIAGSDLATCAYYRERDHATPYRVGESGQISIRDLFLHTYVTGKIGGGCWNKLFHKSVLDREGIRFLKGIAVGEDMVFLARYYQFCSSVHHVDRPLYFYVFQPQSAVQKSYSKKTVQASTLSVLEALDMLEFYLDCSIDFQRRSFAYRRARSSLRLLFQLVLADAFESDALLRIQRHLRAGIGSFLLARDAKGLEKVMVLCGALSSKLAYKLARPAVARNLGRFSAYLE